MGKLFLALVTLVTLFGQLSLQGEAECSQTKPCEAGCCSSDGFCGYGPDYCGEGCLSTCDRKSKCYPGWESDDFSEANKCRLNVCCSKRGFCGHTEEFCGKSDKVNRPSCLPSNKPIKRVIGYYDSWVIGGKYCQRMIPEAIPYGMYTHVVFAFATINPKTFTVSAGDYNNEYMMSRIGALKIVQPDVQIWIALGGWAFNNPGPTETTFSDLAASAEHTNAFVESLAKMLNKYGFDGVDINWQYPVAKNRNGREEDYDNAVKFMKKLRVKMDSIRKGMSMALPARYNYLRNFDVQKLESTVDWFNLMAYDIHGSWDIATEPWVNSHTNLTEIQEALDLLWRNDISPSKVTMGMAFYGRSFTLADSKCSSSGCKVISAGKASRCLGTAGVLLIPEIQDIIKKEELSPTLDSTAAVKMASWGDQWVSFDDLDTWRLKAKLARSQCIQSFIVWALSHDDASGTNAEALNSALERKIPAFPNFSLKKKKKSGKWKGKQSGVCHWTSCFNDCPSGYKSVPHHGHKKIMSDTSNCDQGLGGYGFSRLCCPSDRDLPTCTWRGHRSSGHCKPGCNEGEAEVGTKQSGCSKNHQSACCELTEVTAAYNKCHWSDCFGDDDVHPCVGDHSYFVTSSSIGSGGMKMCLRGKRRAYCCSDPEALPFSNRCEWIRKAGLVESDGLRNFCEGGCPKGQVMFALESGERNEMEGARGCYGELAFCCDQDSDLDKFQDTRGDAICRSTGAGQSIMALDTDLNPTCPEKLLHH